MSGRNSMKGLDLLIKNNYNKIKKENYPPHL